MDHTERNTNESNRLPITGDAPEAGKSDIQNDAGEKPPEFGGRKGPDPVRYGDWEKNGRCIDF